jgi:predicted nucleic acid-binding protein
MANIFLDVNRLIGLIKGEEIDNLSGHNLMISVLSWHITCYLMKWKMPHEKLKRMSEVLAAVELTNEIVKKSIMGPTDDFEDNVQLNSAAEGDCDYFLTMDKKLLKMKFFGKMKISDKI